MAFMVDVCKQERQKQMCTVIYSQVCSAKKKCFFFFYSESFKRKCVVSVERERKKRTQMPIISVKILIKSKPQNSMEIKRHILFAVIVFTVPINETGKKEKH